jgi:hypothetical protein
MAFCPTTDLKVAGRYLRADTIKLSIRYYNKVNYSNITITKTIMILLLQSYGKKLNYCSIL